jgi:hypothetical protein
MLINKASLSRVKTLIRFLLCRIIFFLHLGFPAFSLSHMADADDSLLNLGSPVAPRGRGRPRGSKNKTTPVAARSSSAASVKHRLGRPPGSKNKPKVTGAAPGPRAPSSAAPTAPPRIFSFFCIAMAQCHEIQRLPLNFTKFMDG